MVLVSEIKLWLSYSMCVTAGQLLLVSQSFLQRL